MNLSNHNRPWVWIGLVVMLTLPMQAAHSQSLVRVDTPAGNFVIELFDDIAPETVQNFISYIALQRYRDSFVHRAEPGFVIQGGGWTVSGPQFGRVDKGPTIINEFSESNVRGTIAMAKVGGNPNSASSEWFINLSDNTGLDAQNGGFTVFGRVIDDGMEVVDAIANLPAVELQGQNAPPFPVPLINYAGSGQVFRSNFVFTEFSILSGEYAPPNAFDTETGRIRTKINGDEAGIAEVWFDFVERGPLIRIQADLSSLTPLGGVEAGFTFFEPASGQLVIPELFINGAVAFRNLIFELSNPVDLIFTLQSFE